MSELSSAWKEDRVRKTKNIQQIHQLVQKCNSLLVSIRCVVVSLQFSSASSENICTTYDSPK